MKLTLITPALVAILALAFSNTTVKADTATTSSTSTTDTTATAKKHPFKAQVTAIDTTANTITIQGKEALTLLVTPTTKFKGGTALTDFAVGDTVTGSYTKDASGKLTANSLRKKVAPAATSTSSTTTTSATNKP